MKLSQLDHFELVSDGGCKGNGKPGAKSYGSFALFAVGKDDVKEQGKIEHFDLPNAGTNNEAEYLSLIAGLTYVQSVITRIGGKDQTYLSVSLDSELVANQVLGIDKAKKPSMIALRDQTRVVLKSLSDLNCVVGIGHVDRETVVPILGH